MEAHGMTWGWPGARGTWTTTEARASLDEMARLGANWVTLGYAAYQDTAQSTTIRWREAPTVTDDEIRLVTAQCRELGLRVCLKPVVNVGDGTWRAHIGFFDVDVPGEPTWDEWFESYTEYILHHAALAQELSVDLLCIGCEMVRADAKEAHWRRLVARVRRLYDGAITYNADKYQEDRLTWWDAVDVISASGYYPTGTWDAQLDRIEHVVRRHGKPFYFIEAGCPSREGSAERPHDWSWQGPPSEREQADYLDEMFTACGRREWVRGIILWDWPAELFPAERAASNRDYCVYGKAGAEVVARAFRGSRATHSGPSAVG